MRVVTILLTIVVVILSCGLAFQYNQKAFHARQDLESERYKRLLVEENLEKANSRIGSLDLALTKSQDKIKSMEIQLRNSNIVNADLKNRLDEVVRVKDLLELKFVELQEMSE